MLHIENLSVHYKNKIGIKGLTLESNKGEIVGFIGADGAGKSSALNAIAGVLQFEGRVSYNEVTYTSPKEAEKVKPFIGYMPQGIGLVLYETLTIKEHLDFFTDIRGIKRDKGFAEYKNHLLEMAGLEKFTDRKASNLSGGMMQKLSLVCTMLHRPSLLILDEPTTGVDPLSRIELWEILRQSTQELGTICLVSTAYMAEASKMDKILLFDEAEIIAQGKVDDLLDEVKPYVYKKIQTDKKHITIAHTTYCLESLESPHTEPSLESLFFINSLKKEKLLPKLEVSQTTQEIQAETVVMEAQKITKKFGDFYANREVDIRLKSGEILGLLGANGAGKTTFIKMLLGLLPVDGGELSMMGQRIKNNNDRKELKRHIGYVSQHFALYDDMTVRENILFFASMHNISTNKAIALVEKYSHELDFTAYLDEMPKNLPLGINQRFSLAVSILHEPKILCLDEPTSGVDAIARAQFWELLQALKTKQGISILITTHYMSEAEFCDRVVLLKNGEKIADDTVAGFYKNYPDAKNFEEIFLEYYR